MLEPIAKGTSMIGQAEELLYPAMRVESEVGIVYPRSAFYWDELGVKSPRGIMDCTNHRMMSGRSDRHCLRGVVLLWCEL
jgi:hypothetical protein